MQSYYDFYQISDQIKAMMVYGTLPLDMSMVESVITSVFRHRSLSPLEHIMGLCQDVIDSQELCHMVSSIPVETWCTRFHDHPRNMGRLDDYVKWLRTGRYSNPMLYMALSSCASSKYFDPSSVQVDADVDAGDVEYYESMCQLVEEDMEDDLPIVVENEEEPSHYHIKEGSVLVPHFDVSPDTDTTLTYRDVMSLELNHDATTSFIAQDGVTIVQYSDTAVGVIAPLLNGFVSDSRAAACVSKDWNYLFSGSKDFTTVKIDNTQLLPSAHSIKDMVDLGWENKHPRCNVMGPVSGLGVLNLKYYDTRYKTIPFLKRQPLVLAVTKAKYKKRLVAPGIPDCQFPYKKLHDLWIEDYKSGVLSNPLDVVLPEMEIALRTPSAVYYGPAESESLPGSELRDRKRNIVYPSYSSFTIRATIGRRVEFRIMVASLVVSMFSDDTALGALGSVKELSLDEDHGRYYYLKALSYHRGKCDKVTVPTITHQKMVLLFLHYFKYGVATGKVENDPNVVGDPDYRSSLTVVLQCLSHLNNQNNGYAEWLQGKVRPARCYDKMLAGETIYVIDEMESLYMSLLWEQVNNSGEIDDSKRYYEWPTARLLDVQESTKLDNIGKVTAVERKQNFDFSDLAVAFAEHGVPLDHVYNAVLDNLFKNG